MGFSCCAHNCDSSSDSYPTGTVMFHRFPLKDKARLELWVKAIKRKNFNPTSNSRLCSLHFTITDYDPPVISGPLRLKKNAVPSVFEFSECLMPKQTDSRRVLQRVSTVLATESTNAVQPDLDELPENNSIVEKPEATTVTVATQTCEFNSTVEKPKATTVTVATQSVVTAERLRSTLRKYRVEKRSLQQRIRRQNKKIANLQELLVTILSEQ